MSLTTDDLQQIRDIIEEVVHPLGGDIEALSNDVKVIYKMITELQSGTVEEKTFRKLSLEKSFSR